MKRSKGFSLIEIVAATAAAAMTVGLGGFLLLDVIRTNAKLSQRVSAESLRNLIRERLDCAQTLAAHSPWSPGSGAALLGKAKPIIQNPSQNTAAGEVRVIQGAIKGEFIVDLRKHSASDWRPLFQVPLACR